MATFNTIFDDVAVSNYREIHDNYREIHDVAPKSTSVLTAFPKVCSRNRFLCFMLLAIVITSGSFFRVICHRMTLKQTYPPVFPGTRLKTIQQMG